MPDNTPGSTPSSLKVEEFSGSGSDWDSLAAGWPGSSFCHLAGWTGVMKDALGHDSVRWVATDASGQPHGLLALVEVRSRIFGSYLLSMPFLSYGGPLGSEPAVRALVERAKEEARSRRVDLLELRSRIALPGDLDVSDRKITVLKSLPDSTEELWDKGLRAKVRSQVRRPIKEGMTFRFGADVAPAFYKIFSQTMRDLGTPVLPYRFFEALVDAFPDHVLFGVVEHESQPVAVGCGFIWNGEVEITWAGADRAHSRLAPNMLLYWAFMAESVERGATVFNFGRCSPDSSTHRFKKQWGSEDHALPWAQWSPSGVTATPNPDSPKFRLATRVWRRLPVSWANAIGPMVSRSLP